MITEIAVLEDPSALRTWFPALSGSSGISVTSFTVYLAEAPRNCQSLWTTSPLSHLRIFSFHLSLPGHRVPEQCGRGCFQCTLMFCPVICQEGASSHWYEQYDHEGRWTVTALCPPEDGWKWEGIWFCELCFRALLISCMTLLHLFPSVYKRN